MVNPTPWLLPDATTPGGTACGTQLWFSDAVPSGSSTVQVQYQVGDFLWITSSTSGLPLMYKCTGAPSSTNKDGVWTLASTGGNASKAVSAAYTATASDSLITQSNGVGVAVTLPAASAANAGKSYIVKNNNGAVTNTVVIAGGGLIDGGHTVTLGAAYSSAELRSDGTQYWLVAAFSTVTVT